MRWSDFYLPRTPYLSLVTIILGDGYWWWILSSSRRLDRGANDQKARYKARGRDRSPPRPRGPTAPPEKFRCRRSCCQNSKFLLWPIRYWKHPSWNFDISGIPGRSCDNHPPFPTTHLIVAPADLTGGWAIPPVRENSNLIVVGFSFNLDYATHPPTATSGTEQTTDCQMRRGLKYGLSNSGSNADQVTCVPNLWCHIRS